MRASVVAVKELDRTFRVLILTVIDTLVIKEVMIVVASKEIWD